MAQTELLARSRLVPVADKSAVRTLGEEDLFAYLCMHGALHWWCRLKWLADINALTGVIETGKLERLYEGAKTRGVGRAAAQALLLSRTVFGTSVPEELVHILTKSFGMRWLEFTAVDAMGGAATPHNRRFGTFRGSLSALFLGSGREYQLAELKALLVNEQDVLGLPLPKWLWFLYPILRLPLWAWRHFRAAPSAASL